MMEYHVSPLIKSPESVVQVKPMFDDPYAYVSNLEPLTHHDYFYILKKIEQGWITERDIEIVKFIFVHRWITLSQISRIFFPETDREATVRNRVHKLLKYGLLRKIEWSSYSNPNQNRPVIYELGASGADILKLSYGAFLGHRDPRMPKPITMLFRMKYIATNELFIQLRESFSVKHFEFHPILTLDEDQQIPTARFILKNPNDVDMSFFLVCHREDEKWQKTIRFQAQFYKRYLTRIESNTLLVIVVSTPDKAEIASKILDQEGMLKHTWFVTDNDLYNNQISMSQGFFTYIEGRKLYYDLN